LGEIRDKITRKSKFRDQLSAKLKKFRTKDLFAKGVWIQGPNSIENNGEIKKYKGQVGMNLKIFKTKDQDEKWAKLSGSF